MNSSLELHRVFVSLPESTGAGDAVVLADTELHYLNNVLRLKTNSQVIASCSGSGRSFLATLYLEQKNILLESLVEVQGSTSYVRTLCFALCKGKRNEIVCEKATELGVQQLIFFQAERSVVRLENGSKKLERLNKISQSAARQSGQSTLPKVELLGSLKETLSSVRSITSPNDKLFYGSLEPEAKELIKLQSKPSFAHLLIGPEGDLSPAEMQLLRQSGFEPLSLGPFRLRSETAALTAVATVSAVFGFAKT